MQANFIGVKCIRLTSVLVISTWVFWWSHVCINLKTPESNSIQQLLFLSLIANPKIWYICILSCAPLEHATLHLLLVAAWGVGCQLETILNVLLFHIGLSLGLHHYDGHGIHDIQLVSIVHFVCIELVFKNSRRLRHPAQNDIHGVPDSSLHLIICILWFLHLLLQYISGVAHGAAYYYPVQNVHILCPFLVCCLFRRRHWLHLIQRLDIRDFRSPHNGSFSDRVGYALPCFLWSGHQFLPTHVSVVVVVFANLLPLFLIFFWRRWPRDVVLFTDIGTVFPPLNEEHRLHC